MTSCALLRNPMSIKKERVFSGNFTEVITGFQIIQAKIKSFDEVGWSLCLAVLKEMMIMAFK